ncbi:MAG: biotin transporter BioY [Clostridia bacterium]|nr:biotin transporter BioY [Clostridia bacterium]
MANFNKKALQKIVFASILAAFTAVMAQIAFPLPSGVPVTLQTFAVSLCAFLLGAGWGTASVGIYILVGVLGVPVFSGFVGGVQALFGLTGGFIYGFFPFAFFCGLSNNFSSKVVKIVLCFLGLALCHLLGVIQFAILYKIGFIVSFLKVSAPYIVKDIISVAAAYVTARIVLRRTEKIRQK